MYIVIGSAKSAPNDNDADDDESSSAASQIYLPMSSYRELDLRQLGRIQRRLQQLPSTAGCNAAISVALCDGSGAPIYYRISGGFKEKHL